MQKHYLLIALAAILTMSCEKEVVTEKQDDVTIAKISLGGDYVGITSEPLTKAENQSAYYAFEVDSMHVVKVQEKYYSYNDTTWMHYAEGLFDKDNINNLSIALVNNHKYRVRCGIIKDQEDKLYIDSGRYVYEPYASESFGKGNKTLLTNSFIYGGQQTLWTNLSLNGFARVNDGEKLRFAKLDRYFGEAFVEGGDAIVLYMERCNFGLRFLINAPKEGTLKVYQDYSSPYFEYVLKPGDASISEEHIYMLEPKHSDTSNTDSFANIYLKVEWRKPNGEVVDLSPETIRAYNKTMTTIKVDINSRVQGTDITLTTDGGLTAAPDIIVN